MSNKVTNEAVGSFIRGINFAKGNTTVVTIDGTTYLTIFGNAIMKRAPLQGIFICNGGYPSKTTSTRLNGLMEYVDSPLRVRMKDDTMYLEWCGDKLPKGISRFQEVGEEWVHVNNVAGYFENLVRGIF